MWGNHRIRVIYRGHDLHFLVLFILILMLCGYISVAVAYIYMKYVLSTGPWIASITKQYGIQF